MSSTSNSSPGAWAYNPFGGSAGSSRIVLERTYTDGDFGPWQESKNMPGCVYQDTEVVEIPLTKDLADRFPVLYFSPRPQPKEADPQNPNETELDRNYHTLEEYKSFKDGPQFNLPEYLNKTYALRNKSSKRKNEVKLSENE